MKKLLLAISLLVLSTPSWAQGTCPTASIYFNVPIQSFTTLSAAGVTGCYFVSNAGLDTNSGTTEGAAWAHAPGMNGCASNCAITPSPGTGIIFRGGDTWGSTEYFNISFAGTSGAPIYYTVDPTWYSGGSWNRPLLSIAGALPNVNANGESRIIGLTAGWINFDWWEVTGMTCSSTVSQNLMWNNSQYDGLVMTDSYIHGFEAPNTLCAVTTKLPDGQNPAVWLYTQVSGNISNCHGAFEYNVVDGTDGTGTKGYQTVVADPAPCATFAYNVVHDICSGFGGNLSSPVHDNYIGQFGGAVGQFECAPGLVNELHNHAIRSNIDCTAAYNNVINQTEGEVISCNPAGPSTPTGIYNNVAWDNVGNNSPSAVELCDNGAGHCTAGVAYLVHNTFAMTGISPGLCLNVENAIASLLTIDNFDIYAGAGSSSCYENTGNATSYPTPTGETYLTAAQATTDGYLATGAYPYSPTNANSPTVGAGVSESLGATSTTYACVEGTINGVVQAICPAKPAITRVTYDSGAAQFGSGTPQLPTTWVDNNEALDGVVYTPPAYELSLPSTWEPPFAVPPPGCTFHLPYWSGTPTQTGLQSAINDIEACRTQFGYGIILDVPPGDYTVGTSIGTVIPQTNTVAASVFNIIRSTQDVFLPNGQTVCSHGIQDNLPTSTDPGLDNPDCFGDEMYYQLGKTVTFVPEGAFTLANGSPQNTANYNDVQYMYTLECSGTNCSALTFCSPLGTNSSSNPPLCAGATIAPDHWLIEDAEARMAAGNAGNQNVVNLTQTSTETSTSQLPTHIHLRKIWQHGDYTTITAGFNSISAGISFVCSYCSIVDSQTSENLRPGSEGHSVFAQGPGPYKFSHNWLEGQSIGIFAGGWSGRGLPFNSPPYVNFQDVEMRRNRLTFPYDWLGVMTIPSGHYAGYNVVRKNSNEFKEGERILEDGNIFENVDNSGGQSGALMDFDTRNCSACTPELGNNYQSIISDVTFTNDIGRNSCEGPEVDKSSGDIGVAYGVYRIAMDNDLFYNVTTNNPGCTGVASRGFAFSNSAGIYWQGTVTENSQGTAETFTATCNEQLQQCPGQIASLAVGSPGADCVAGSLVISAPTAGGYQATGTYTCSAGHLGAVTLTANTTGIIGGSNYLTPPTVTLATGTGTVAVTMVSSATAPGLGFQVLDINSGDPAPITNCTTTALNNVSTAVYGGRTIPSGRAPLASVGSTPWNGTSVPGNLSVTVPWAATANTSDVSGYCTLTQVQGQPNNMALQHVSLITDAAYAIASNNNPTSGAKFQQNTTVQNSIILGPWENSQWSSTPGTTTETLDFDATSMTADHNVWPGQTSSNYTSYGNNPFLPVASPLMYFPTTSYCTGGVPSSTCVGFNGALGTSSMPLALDDYHGYELSTESIFYAGNSSDASDGSSMGPNIPMIDAAETSNLYVCGSPCGSPGPFPDLLTLGIPPYNFCFQTQGGISAAVAAIYALPNVNCVLIDFGWNQIDTGTAAPSFQWTTYDTANVQAFAPGFTVGSCTTSGGTTSCGVTSATLVAGQHAYIGGNSGCSGDHLLASGTSSTITFTSSCVGTGGTVENSCGSNLAQGGQPCKLVVQSQQTFAVGSAKNPAYPFTQSYANSVAPAWTAVTNYGFHSIVTHGGNYYHNTTIGAAGYCTEGATFGSVCAWANDGTTNALPQEVAIGTTFLGDGNGPPSSLWTNGGITFNANSNNCGVSGTTNCGTIGTEPSAFPLYWQTPIQAALINFCTGTDGTNPGMLPHYNSTLGLQLLAIQCGAPQSEEWFFPLYPYLTAQYSMNFTQAAGLYINYAGNTVWSAIHAEYAALGSPSGWGMLVPDGIYAGCSPQSACNTYSDLIASVSLAYAENSPGNVGLRESDPINYATSQPVNGDFVNIFANYPNTKFHFSEPFSLSCPVWSGQAGCAPATQTITGPLNWIFPFLAAHITTGSAASLVVPFGDDIVCAFDASFTVTVSGGAYPPCAFTAYQSPLAAMASGTAAYLLTAAIGGGSGTVTDTTVINCPSSACQAEYFAGGVATLTATPSVGYSFTSWSGGCSGSSASTTVTMSAAKTCTAAFSSTTPQAATPTFSPVAGTYVGTQSVTISTSSAGAIICYNTTGAPQTNGTTGCTVGTLYSGPVAVNSSETLYAVAGGTGYTDSTAGSASYTITSNVTGGFTIFVGSQTVPGTDILP